MVFIDMVKCKQGLILDFTPPDDCDKYIDIYMRGWERIRKDRHARLIQQGVIPSTWRCSPRDEHSPPWESVVDKEWEAARMACYAAQISIMDRGIGRVLEVLRRTDQYDNTVIFFMSDNGGECSKCFTCLLQTKCV